LVFALAKLEVVKVRKTLDGKHSNDFISTGDGVVVHFLRSFPYGGRWINGNRRLFHEKTNFAYIEPQLLPLRTCF
jgi:hypothetical protein